MDYLRAKFGDFGLIPFWFYQADRQTESQMRDERYTNNYRRR